MILLIHLIIFSCATTQSTVPFEEETVRDEGKSLFYFYRVDNFVGSVVAFEVLMDRDELGTLNIGGYFTEEIASGKHQLIVKVAGDVGSWSDTLRLVVKPSSVYFVRISGLKMEIVDESIALNELENMKKEEELIK